MQGAADVVVDVVQLPALEVERPAADAGPLAEQDAFGAARRYVRVREAGFSPGVVLPSMLAALGGRRRSVRRWW